MPVTWADVELPALKHLFLWSPTERHELESLLGWITAHRHIERVDLQTSHDPPEVHDRLAAEWLADRSRWPATLVAFSCDRVTSDQSGLITHR